MVVLHECNHTERMDGKAASHLEPVMKDRVEELALFGGPAAFAESVHVGRPNIGDRQRLRQRFEAMLDSRWLSNHGPFVEEFEQAVCRRIGARYCVATCNATVAIQVLARAACLSGEVIVPSFTFVGTAHALRWVGLKPVFADIEPRTHTIDPAAIATLVTARTSAIMGVHLWGRACNIDALERAAARHGLALFFDASQAMGSTYRGRPIGRWGRAEVLSFHATKVVNSFEGGAIVTDDESLATRAGLIRQFGFAGYDTVTMLGTNGKMTEAAGLMGLTSLEALDGLIAANMERFERYRERLLRIPGISLIERPRLDDWNHHYVVLEIDEQLAGIRADELQALLFTENVLARRYFFPGCHRVEPYRSEVPRADYPLPATERVAARVLCLPTGEALPLDAVDAIAALIRLAVRHAPEVRAKLRDRGQLV